MIDKVFVDTNVFVYSFDHEDLRKQQIAHSLIYEAGSTGALVLSTQVLQELYVSITQKIAYPLPREDALEAIRLWRNHTIVQITPDIIYESAELSAKMKLSFWDGLIVVSAQTQGCTTIYTEDLQDGQKIGGLTIRNPFK